MLKNGLPELIFDKHQFENIYKLKIPFDINTVSNPLNIKKNSIVFVLDLTDKIINSINTTSENIIFIPKDSDIASLDTEKNIIIESINPKFEYIRCLQQTIHQEFSPYNKGPLGSGISDKAYVSPDAKIGNNVNIHPFSYVGPNCFLDDEVILLPGANLIQNVQVGKGSIIGSNTTIGAMGFALERDNKKKREVISFNGRPYQLPHYGGVIIGKECHIASNTTVVSGSIEPTIIEDYVHVDDHVHIAHNCHVKEGSLVVACAEVSGSVVLGKESWIGPNAAIMQKVEIGDQTIVGLGAIVLKSTDPGSIMVGNPAKNIKKD